MSQYITIGIVTVNPLRHEAACLYKIFTFFALYSSKYHKNYTQLKLNRPDVLSRYKSIKIQNCNQHFTDLRTSFAKKHSECVKLNLMFSFDY